MRRSVALVVLICHFVLIAGCSGSGSAELAKAKAEAEAARTEALTAKAELEKARAAPVVTPEPTLSREQAIANIEKLGGTIEYEKGFKDGPISTIHLHNDRFTDDDLANLQPLNEAVSLNIVSPAVTDAGLRHLKGMTRVRSMQIYMCGRIDGSGFDSLKDLKQLSKLVLHGTRVNDAGLAHLQGMSELAEINLIGCPITGEGLKGVAGAKTWFLDLSGTKTDDEGLMSLSGLPAIHTLSLGNTPISDAGLVHLKSLPALTVLNLIGTSVTDAGLEHLQGLSKLQTIYVQNTKVTEAGIKKLQESLPKLKVLQ